LLLSSANKIIKGSQIIYLFSGMTGSGTDSTRNAGAHASAIYVGILEA